MCFTANHHSEGSAVNKILEKNRPGILTEYGLQLADHELVNTDKRLRRAVVINSDDRNM